jgi:hypothetical protein
MTASPSICVLNIVLIAALLFIAAFHATQGAEYFQAPWSTASAGSSDSSPFGKFAFSPTAVTPNASDTATPCESGSSVFSSFPPQNAVNAAWKYVAPFQQTCLGCCTVGSEGQRTCQSGQRFVCHLTPHNQRICHWE